MACAERTIPGTIDATASTSPDQLWAQYPETQQHLEQGELKSVTFHDLAQAIDNLAWRLDAALPSRRYLQTVAYIGPSDIRYFIFACAASKCRLKVSELELAVLPRLFITVVADAVLGFVFVASQ